MYQRLLYYLVGTSGILLICCACQANEVPGQSELHRLQFVEPGPLAEALITTDSIEGYFNYLSETDMRLQMGLAASDTINKTDYLAWLASCPQAWPSDLVNKMQRIWGQVLSESVTVAPHLVPDTIFLLVTADKPYGSEVYFTRNMAVIMPVSDLRAASDHDLLHTMRHELFHLVSRMHYGLRPKLYEMSNCLAGPEGLKWPADLYERRLSNPDAPNYNFLLMHEGQAYLPVLTSPVQRIVAPKDALFSANIRADFYEIIGDSISLNRLPEWEVAAAIEANSYYIIHPEEVLAEHYAFLLGGQRVERPGELSELESLLQPIE